jgi:AcrR family transcriptional regulator
VNTNGRPASGSQKRPQKRGRKRRAEIVAVARHQLLTFGYDNFVIHQIAEEVGISPGNLQYYFPTRDDLLIAVCLDIFSESQHILLDANERATSPRERWLAVIDNLLNNWASLSGYAYIIMHQLAVHHPKVKALKRDIYLGFYDQLMRLLQETSPGMTKQKRRKTVRVITSILDGVVYQYQMGPGDKRDPAGVDLEADVRELVLSLVGL